MLSAGELHEIELGRTDEGSPSLRTGRAEWAEVLVTRASSSARMQTLRIMGKNKEPFESSLLCRATSDEAQT